MGETLWVDKDGKRRLKGSESSLKLKSHRAANSSGPETGSLGKLGMSFIWRHYVVRVTQLYNLQMSRNSTYEPVITWLKGRHALEKVTILCASISSSTKCLLPTLRMVKIKGNEKMEFYRNAENLICMITVLRAKRQKRLSMQGFNCPRWLQEAQVWWSEKQNEKKKKKSNSETRAKENQKVSYNFYIMF